MRIERAFGFLLLLLVVTACRGRGEGVPRPEGFVRIERVDTAYRSLSESFPLAFEVPSQIRVDRKSTEPTWINLVYPHYNATLWCSYLPLVPENREKMYAESRELVYVHATQAASIDVQHYADDERKVYALLYALSGGAATPLQFVVTDSVSYLFRGALYFDTSVRIDSVAPVVGYITDDVIHLIETLQINR